MGAWCARAGTIRTAHAYVKVPKLRSLCVMESGFREVFFEYVPPLARGPWRCKDLDDAASIP